MKETKIHMQYFSPIEYGIEETNSWEVSVNY